MTLTAAVSVKWGGGPGPHLNGHEGECGSCLTSGSCVGLKRGSW